MANYGPDGGPPPRSSGGGRGNIRKRGAPTPYYVDSYSSASGPPPPQSSNRPPPAPPHGGGRGNYHPSKRPRVEMSPPYPPPPTHGYGPPPPPPPQSYYGHPPGGGRPPPHWQGGGGGRYRQPPLPAPPYGYQQPPPPPHHHHQGPPPSSAPARPPRVYSDFRIAKTRIGDFEVVEANNNGPPPRKNERDSRIRLYFKTSDEQQPTQQQSYGMNARERALSEPDRLSISMYQGTKRMIIPVQDGLDKIIFNREQGHFKIHTKGWALFEEVDTQIPNSSFKGNAQFRKCQDFTKNELEQANGFIEVWIDKKNPLSMEPKWTRGNIRDYIDSRSKFRTKNVLEVEDPEKIDDFDAIVQLWVRESTISNSTERQNFAENKLSQLNYMLELTSKILAPPHYYVSKNANTSNPQVASMLESGQIPALISPSINTLIATLTNAILTKAGLPNEVLVSSLKIVLFQVPEPIIWRSLDGLFGKRNELLNFNPEKVLSLAIERSSGNSNRNGVEDDKERLKEEDEQSAAQDDTNYSYNDEDDNSYIKMEEDDNNDVADQQDEDEEVTYEA